MLGVGDAAVALHLPVKPMTTGWLKTFVMQGDAFGCPYKTLSPGELADTLRALRLPPASVQDAVAKARGGHFQLACMAAWEGAHGRMCDTGVNHPNQVWAWPAYAPCLIYLPARSAFPGRRVETHCTGMRTYTQLCVMCCCAALPGGSQQLCHVYL